MSGDSKFQRGPNFKGVKISRRLEFRRCSTFREVKTLTRSKVWGGQSFSEFNFLEVLIRGAPTFKRSTFCGDQNVLEVKIYVRSQFWGDQNVWEVRILGRSTN